MSASVTLVTGGIKSGKTAYAMDVASRYPSRVYLATTEVVDDEMRRRVDAHKAERGSGWSTIEEPVDLADGLDRACEQAGADGAVLIDCITMWVNNLLYHDVDIPGAAERFMQSLSAASSDVVIVTNEVGFGIVPADAETRRYARELGALNARIARYAGAAYLLVSGLPMKIK